MSGTERAHGPYGHGKRFKIVIVGADGTRGSRTFATEAEAIAYRDSFRNATNTRTIGEAVTEYLDALRGKLRDSSVVTLRYRLMAFLRLPSEDRLLRQLTVQHARYLARKRAEETSAATQRGELSVVSRFVDEQISLGRMRSNVVEGIEPTGKVERGKPQLRVNEARALIRTLLSDPSREATAVLMALLMGLRAHEVIGRIARDVDDDGRLLWITESKTRAGVRQVAIPSVLRDRLLELSAETMVAHDAAMVERGDVPVNPSGKLFPELTRYGLHYHTIRFAKLAGVPRVTPHGLRGTFATLAMTGEMVGIESLARAFGHDVRDRGNTLRRHYLAPGAEETARVRQLESVIGVGTSQPETVPSEKSSDASSSAPSENAVEVRPFN